MVGNVVAGVVAELVSGNFLSCGVIGQGIAQIITNI